MFRFHTCTGATPVRRLEDRNVGRSGRAPGHMPGATPVRRLEDRNLLTADGVVRPWTMEQRLSEGLKIGTCSCAVAVDRAVWEQRLSEGLKIGTSTNLNASSAHEGGATPVRRLEDRNDVGII